MERPFATLPVLKEIHHKPLQRPSRASRVVPMRAVSGFLALAVVLLLPLAAAKEAPPTDAAEKPALGRVLDVVDSLAGKGAAIGASAASGAAKGADAAAEGTSSFFTILASAASAATAAASSAAGATGRALVAVGSAIADVAVVAGRTLAAAAVAVGRALAAFGALLASLFRSGAGWVADHPRESLYTVAGAGAAGAATGLLLWLKRLGAFAPIAGLYTRLTSGEILDNGVRARVFEEVRSNPGAHPSQIKEKLHIGWGTVVYHLDRLEETGLVTSRTGSGRKCYFVNGSGIAVEAQKATAALKHPSAKAIADVVRENPGVTQKILAERTGMSPALVSWHVRRLAAAGILAQERTSAGVALRLAAVPLAA